MKRILLFTFFIFSFTGLEAQNWKLFQAEGIYHFNPSNIQSIRVDSVEAVGADSVYYFNWVFNDSMTYAHYNGGPNFNQVDSFLMPNFFGKSARLSVDSSWMKTQEGDEILILHLASLGQQWELLNNGFLIVRATVDSLYTDSVNGMLDSLKRIRLNTFNNSGNPVSHSINNKKLILSKNHGFIQSMNFYYLWYFGSTINEKLLNRAFVDLNRTRRQIFDYQVGDEFHLSFDEWLVTPNPYPTDYINAKILTSQLSPNSNSISYSYSELLEENTATLASNPSRIIYHKNIFLDTISSQKHNLDTSFMKGLPGEVHFNNQSSGWREFNEFKVRSDLYNGRLQYRLQRVYITDTLGTYTYTLFTDDVELFIEGVCWFKNEYWVTGGSGQNRTWYNLLYFKKGNEIWGQPRIVTHIEEPEKVSKVAIYPNPSSGLVHIESDKAIQQVYLYNLQGQEIPVSLERDQSINLPETPGLYLLEIQFQAGETKIFKMIKE